MDWAVRNITGSALPCRYPLLFVCREAVVKAQRMRRFIGRASAETSILLLRRILDRRALSVQLSQRGDGGSDGDDANDGGDTAVHTQKP